MKMEILQSLLWLLVTGVALTNSARILAFFTIPVSSHHFIYRPILEELGKRGHEILYVTPVPYKGEVPKGIEQMDISKYMSLPEYTDPNLFREFSVFRMISSVYQFGMANARSLIGNEVVQRLIHSDEKFDVVMIETFFVQEYLSALIHKFNAIGVEIVPSGDCSWANELSGLPDNPSYQVDWKADLHQDMSFIERVYNYYVYLMTTVCGYFYMTFMMQPLMDQYFNYTGWEERPTIEYLTKNRSLILGNYHPFFTHPFPSAPHFKSVGGVNIRPNKPLPQDIQEFLDLSENGAIYMSFGSNVNLSNPSNAKVIDAFMRAFKEIPQNILMKYETEYKGEVPKNVKMKSWMPQQDILAHKNVVLFISHGGFLSVIETLYHGVPTLGVPFFGDQVKTMLYVDSKGLGKILHFKDITKERVLENIIEIINNGSYKEEVMKRSRLIRDARHTPLEEAVYWIEHTIKYPYVLTPKSTRMAASHLRMLDVKIFVIIIFGFTALIVYSMFELVYRIVIYILSKFWNSNGNQDEGYGDSDELTARPVRCNNGKKSKKKQK